jgi:SpoVK/Ycf46/Vps4 family AAA+-type ATPase
MSKKLSKNIIRAEKILNSISNRLGQEEGIPQSIEDHIEEVGIENDYEDDYNAQSNTIEITFVEFAIINMYLHNCFKGKYDEVVVSSYGQVDSSGRLSFGGVFENTGSYWFNSKFKDVDNDFLFQTKMFVDHRNELQIQLHITAKKAITYNDFEKFQKKIMELSFNNSEYKGKCIKVKMKDGRFRGIEIIDIKQSSNELILNDVQKKFIDHFVTRVERGGNARYLLNGEPGTGKTESIREIARRLIPKVTFIIPDFDTTDDLTSIMEACEIFESGVIIMDDIDLYLGSRDNGSYTRLLGQFLSFFDGVKKRKISLLASTNDKGLVDKAAERPGRFNFTLDYNFLDAEQIVKVCNIHLPEKWRIQEVYDALTEKINGKKVNITGAFIANLAENIREMSEGDVNWGVEDTVSLIKESYKGFYSSQIEKEKQGLGFKL